MPVCGVSVLTPPTLLIVQASNLAILINNPG